MNTAHEERVCDLIDELNAHPEDEFLSGHMMRAWAERCLEHEEEESIATVAVLEVAAGLVPTLAPLAAYFRERKHRLPANEAMTALKEALGR